MMLSSNSTANTPTVTYYPLNSFTTAGQSNELLESNMGRTSRIRFSIDSESTSPYMMEQKDSSSQQQQPISILTTVPSSTDARNTLKRVKI